MSICLHEIRQVRADGAVVWCAQCGARLQVCEEDLRRLAAAPPRAGGDPLGGLGEGGVSRADINRPLAVKYGGPWQEFRAYVATVLFGWGSGRALPGHDGLGLWQSVSVREEAAAMTVSAIPTAAFLAVQLAAEQVARLAPLEGTYELGISARGEWCMLVLHVDEGSADAGH